ncbi:ABC transporter substrate-binding protein [Sulfurovum sp. ST-21]|uniref:ABC transporter substrate-binding protein n=1 Tax=Sulfurovum indicum TaxID=2779528 RepID=A0A7M1S1P5_9BACT|nr:ABC transporter substrate-binding protein [Sulfurovum indicum]QOR61266.1 ABC transporter substrate-binding protein [Sulfurovum indicum]
MIKLVLSLFAALGLVISYYTFEHKTYNEKVIKLGLSLPKSGIMRAWGQGVYAGANAYFTYANENHLLDKKIKLIIYDDKYEPELTLDNTKKLIKENVFSFFGYVGTPTTKKILPLLQESNIPLIAPFTGASFLRKNTNIINFRSSYKEEIETIVDYLYRTKGIIKFAVFYQNDDYGEEGYIALLEALKKRKLTLYGEGTYKRNTLSIKHAFHEIKNADPDAILMIGAYQANALFINRARKNNDFTNTVFCNISFSNADEIIKELDHHTENLLFSQVVPNYQDSQKPVVLEYKKIMRQYAPNQPLGFISLESFLAAKTVVAALQRIKGSTTQENFIKTLTTLPHNTLHGLKLQFKNRQLHNHIYLFTYKNNAFEEINYEY